MILKSYILFFTHVLIVSSSIISKNAKKSTKTKIHDAHLVSVQAYFESENRQIAEYINDLQTQSR